MAQNQSHSMPVFSPVPMAVTESNTGYQPWTFLFNYIHPSASTLLSIIGSAYVVIGIVLTGLEAGIIDKTKGE